jgi:hypothetical protein
LDVHGAKVREQADKLDKRTGGQVREQVSSE